MRRRATNRRLSAVIGSALRHGFLLLCGGTFFADWFVIAGLRIIAGQLVIAG
jgi:hypothetical protein